VWCWLLDCDSAFGEPTIQAALYDQESLQIKVLLLSEFCFNYKSIAAETYLFAPFRMLRLMITCIWKDRSWSRQNECRYKDTYMRQQMQYESEETFIIISHRPEADA